MKTTTFHHCWVCKDWDGTEVPATHRIIVRPGFYGYDEEAMPICADCIEAAQGEDYLIVDNEMYEVHSMSELLEMFPRGGMAGAIMKITLHPRSRLNP